MKSVKAIHISPVKSLGLANPDAVHVGMKGIAEDRRLFLINDRGRLLTQREVPRLVQISAEYNTEPEWLRLAMPDGGIVEGTVEPGEPVITRMWGRDVMGCVATGDWNSTLTDFCGEPVRLVRSDEAGQCYDEYPISLLSDASVQGLNRLPGTGISFDSRRFRPNILIGGCEPHEEDTWLGAVIKIGEDLLLRVTARDPRCAITTHDPTTGEEDFDTPKLVISYRPSDRAAYFGVYGLVERPGLVSIGDTVTAGDTITAPSIGSS